MSRDINEYLKLHRFEFQNHYRTIKSKNLPEAAKPGSVTYFFKDYLGKNIWGWFYHYIRNRFGPKHRFLTYENKIKDNGIYELTNSNPATKEIKIVMCSDWATDTDESDLIGEIMKKHNADYTIHLGDTYYVGTPDEIKNNFINKDSSWTRGASGSFALLGNHEMYSRGISYFRDLLPTLGIYDKDSGRFTGQKTSYFCLQNDYWRIIALDTGYHSTGFPILEFILHPKCGFEESIITWLKEKVNLQNDKRGIILLTHHQYCSSFDTEYNKAAEQLSEIIGQDRNVLWFWGHEHRFSIYGKYKSTNGITAFGRCIGHGGIPNQITEPDTNKIVNRNLILFDKRKYETIEGMDVSFNGFTVLKINDNRILVEYRDINDTLLLSEEWESDIQKRIIKGINIEDKGLGLTLMTDIQKAIN